MNRNNITHTTDEIDFQYELECLESKINKRGDLPHVTVSEQLNMLQQLKSSPLGSHILCNKGSNAFWTDYMIAYPWAHAHNRSEISDMEKFLCYNSPGVLAQRELFLLSQQVAQQSIANGSVLASVPCGVMRDLLFLDYADFKDVTLIGVDIDLDAIDSAKTIAQEKDLQIQLIHENAWSIQGLFKADFINSIGLNVYENDRGKVVDLYKIFYDNLNINGTLFSGVLTYPPWINDQSDWDVRGISSESLRNEQILVNDILDVKWQNYRRIDEVKLDFIEAGFSDITVVPDKYNIFPAIIAKKT